MIDARRQDLFSVTFIIVLYSVVRHHNTFLNMLRQPKISTVYKGWKKMVQFVLFVNKQYYICKCTRVDVITIIKQEFKTKTAPNICHDQQDLTTDGLIFFSTKKCMEILNGFKLKLCINQLVSLINIFLRFMNSARVNE